jgi:membrane-associated phospholipid phosphatase
MIGRMGELAAAATSRFDWRARRLVERSVLPLYTLLALEVLALALGMRLGGFHYDAGALVDPLREAAILALFGWGVRWSGFPRVAAYLELVALLIAGGLLVGALSLIAHAAALPLADDVLSGVDRLAFGFDRALIGTTLPPRALAASNWIYNSVALSMQVMLVALLWRHGVHAAVRLVTAMQLAMIVAIAISALVPAFGTPPYAYAFQDVLTGIRSGALRSIDAQTLTGIVTFPSLHAAGGALLALGFIQIGRVALPFVALNLLVVVSAVTSGGHYLTDVLAGLAVAAGGYAAARRLIPSAPPPFAPSAS